MTNWLQHVEDWKDCQRCALAQQRSRICLARGTVPCDVCFVGEAPGMNEDAHGLPFYGPAGDRLELIISRAFEPWHGQVSFAYTNLVACFPREAKARGDNEPERGEVLECRPRLIEFVNVAQPRLIVRVGKMVEQYMNFDSSVPMVDITHPAHILRMPDAQKSMATNRQAVKLRCAWEDVLQLPVQPWKEWGAKGAKVQQGEEGFYDDYYQRTGSIHPDDDSIPF